MAEDRGTYTTDASVAPQDAPSEPGKIIPLAGCITGDAREVNRRLKQARYPSRITQLLRQLEEMTFSQAGMHRKWGHTNPGSWCWFELAQWASDLAMPKSTILHLRKRLIDDHVVWFEPHPDTAGVGRIGWNLNFSEWKPLQPSYPTWGGARAGAGKKKSRAEVQAAIDNLNTTVDNLKTESSLDNSSCQQSLSSYQSTYAENAFKISMDDSLEACADAARDGVPNNSYEKKEDPANAGQVFATLTPVASAQAQASHDQTSEKASKRTAQRVDVQIPPSSAAPPKPSARAASKPKREPKRERKMTDEEYAKHCALEAWCMDLIKRMRAERGVAVLPEEGREKTAAKWFYNELLGVEDGVMRVINCYRLTKRRPFWNDQPLPLYKLQGFFAEYRRDPVAYRRKAEDEEARARQRAGSHPNAAPSGEPPQYQPSSAQDIWK